MIFLIASSFVTLTPRRTGEGSAFPFRLKGIPLDALPFFPESDVAVWDLPEWKILGNVLNREPPLYRGLSNSDVLGELCSPSPGDPTGVYTVCEFTWGH